MPVDELRAVLRALAEVRDQDFYKLWVLLTHRWPKPRPTIEFRIYQVADSADALVVVLVDGTRPDGTEFDWGLTVKTSDDGLAIAGSISMRETDGAGSEVFHTSAITTDPHDAASLVHAVAAEVCGRRQWIDQSGS